MAKPIITKLAGPVLRGGGAKRALPPTQELC